MTNLRLNNIGRNTWFSVATAVLIGGLCWQLYRTGLTSAAPRVYTVVRTEKGFDKSGALKFTVQYLDAVRSDGAVVHKFTSDLDRRRRIGFPAGNGVAVNDLIGKKSTYSKNFPGLFAYRNPDKSCASDVDVQAGIMLQGVEYVGGHRALRYGSRGGGRGWTTWYAADAGCALLQQRFEHETGVTVQELTSLTLTEPDDSLFAIAANIVEVPPSGLIVPRCRDGKCDSVPDVVKARMDKKYQESQN